MTTRRVLLLCVWLAGLHLSCPDDPAPGPAPNAQVGVLTEGLLRLLSGVEESERLVERQSRQAAQELRRHARELSRVRRRTQRVDRLWAGLRRELQLGAAREEGLRRGAESLRELIGWEGLESRMARIQELVQAPTGPRGAKAALNLTALQAELEVQDRRLSDLSQELLIQDGLVAQQDQCIAELQAMETREELQSFV